MTEESWPWSTVVGLGDGSAELGEANSREFLALYFGVQNPSVEGVCKGLLIGELEVSGIATPLSVDPGAAICYGLYISDDTETLPVSTPAIGTTGGRVVLQTNWAGTGGAGLEARTRLAVLMSADGVPGIPALTQAFGTTWEISLATFTVTVGGVITVTDDRTFRRSTAMVDTDEIIDLAVETGKIANDAVDDTKAGNRVPQFYRRQGGSAFNWGTMGNINYTPGAVRIQAGNLTFSDGGDNTVTFPQAFAFTPIVIAVASSGTVGVYAVHIVSVSTSNFIAAVYDNAGNRVQRNVFWLAIGPE